MNKKKNLQNLSFKIANIKDKKKILSFLKKNFNKKHIFIRNKKFFDWQHIKGNSITFGLATNNKKLVCLQGFVPQSHYDQNLSKNEISMTIASGGNSAPPASLLRLFYYIKKKIRTKIIITSGFVPRTKKYNEKLGFKINLMDHFFKITKKNSYKLLKVGKVPYQKIKIKNNFYKELTKKDFKDNKFKKLYKCSLPHKSNNFIINRYIKHPIFKYNVFEVFDKRNTCIVVIRVINLKKTSMIKIVDYIGKENNILNIGNLIDYLEKKYKPEVIDFCSYGINSKYLKNLGFLDRRKFKNLIIPDHTSPLEKKNIDLFTGHIVSKKKEKFIRIMRGDGDRDRPS